MTAWEIVTESTPFEGLKPLQIMKKVCMKGERPSTEGFDEDTKKLVEMCWAQEPDERLTFEEIEKVRRSCRKDVFFRR
jgi:hypothetical protein